MIFKEYLQQLADSGELKKVESTVSPELELAAICRSEFDTPHGGSAILFNSVHGSAYPVAANLFGSKKRLATLLHSTSLDHFSRRLTGWLQKRNGTAIERLENIEELASTAIKPTQLTELTNLSDLPVIKSWPHEGGRYLNLCLTLTQHPETGERNLGLYRAQVLNDNRLALNFSPHSGAGRHFEIAKRRGEALPLCLLLGVDPALIWVAAAPLPDGCDEFVFYQSLFEEKLSWADATTQPLKLPVETDLVIEGTVLTDETAVEGPYGNHTGHYVTRNDCPLVEVTAVCHRPQPVVPLTVVGPPPSENIYLGMANEVLIREMIKLDYPQVKDVWMPQKTIFHGAAVVAVNSQSQSSNKALIHELWKNSPLRRSRFLLLVDENAHIRSISNSWWRLVNGLKSPRIYSDGGRTAIDATEIDSASLVQEDQKTAALLQQRKDEYFL